MRTLRSLAILVAVLLLAAVVARAQQPAAETVTIGAKSIRGVVSGPQGREAGVWVIAETTQLPTKFARIVVTDDQGRYLIPDLPQADYSVLVRGYGLVDSPKMRGKARAAPRSRRGAGPERGCGRALLSGDLLVFAAEDPGQEGVRRRERHPGRRHPAGLADGHEEPRLRRLSPARPGGDPHNPRRVLRARSSEEAWMRRVQSGQAGERWSTRSPARSAARRSSISPTGPIASPRASCRSDKPPRPQGVERNVVITDMGMGPTGQDTCTT